MIKKDKSINSFIILIIQMFLTLLMTKNITKVHINQYHIYLSFYETS